jgi:hypothetical protein
LYYTANCFVCRGIIDAYACGGPGEPCNANSNPYFRPQNSITMGEIARSVSMAAGFTESTGAQQFQDVPPGSRFFEHIGRLYNRGLVSGYPCGTTPDEPCLPPGNLPYFRPNSTASQGLVAKIVSNAANFQDAVSGQTFEDVPPSHAFYVFIERLAARKVITGYPCGGPGEPCGPNNRPYFRPNSTVTRSQLTMIVAGAFPQVCVLIKYEAGDASYGSYPRQ